MTIHLYYDDSYLVEFSGVVRELRPRGERYVVILDRTAFYPTSGGQPHDTGTLGSARVVEVEADDSGGILHVVDTPVPPGPVQGRIDWARRFDHMQQHTGQHILSQAFVRVARAATVSFHLGNETSTIDIDLSEPDSSLIVEAENLACCTVFENRRVAVLKSDREGLGALGVRKESDREGEIRVIDVEGFDRSPCGGTHVRNTGETGLISILGYERYKGRTRVEFVCGGRVLRVFRTEHDLLRELGRLHSSAYVDLPRLTEKLLQERGSLLRENARLRDQIFDFEAQDLVNRADKTHVTTLVSASFPGRSLESVKILAQKVAARPRAVAILAAVQGTAQVVVARNPEAAGDCGAAVKQAAARLGGKGGGKPGIAQAGGIAAGALDAWVRELEEYFSNINRAAG